MGEVREFWANVAAKAHVSDPSSVHYLRITRLFDVVTPLCVGDVALRTFSVPEANALGEELIRRNVYARHGRYTDKYVQQASRFGRESIVHAVLEAAAAPDNAREVSNRAERLVFVATTYWLQRMKLHKRLVLAQQHDSDPDLFLDVGLQHPSMRSRRRADPTRITVDEGFAKRFRRYGFPRVAACLLRPKGFAAEKADRGIAWLREARFEVQNDAAIVKAVIGLEALFVQERGEPLAHTISERVAFLLGRDPAQRAVLYRITKRLYDARSNVVHSGHRERVSADTVEVATRLLLMAAQGLAENAGALSSKDATRQLFEDMRWGTASAPPRLPFPAGTIVSLIRSAKRAGLA